MFQVRWRAGQLQVTQNTGNINHRALQLNPDTGSILWVPSVTSTVAWLLYALLWYYYLLWYGAVRPSVRSSVRPTVSTKKHRCKWGIFFKFCTQVCFGVPSINLLFVWSYLIKYAHNSIISDFSIFGIHRVIFTRGQFWPSGIVVACVCVCVCVCVCPYVCQSLACPRDNSGPVQTRIAKFGPKMQKTLVKVPIVLGGNWPWPSRSNLTS